eukprot:9334955-Pyramimonas_sp.AAC.1
MCDSDPLGPPSDPSKCADVRPGAVPRGEGQAGGVGRSPRPRGPPGICPLPSRHRSDPRVYAPSPHAIGPIH